MKAVITVIGRDTVGVVAKVSAVCAELNINIEDITQSIMQDMFCMIMLVDMAHCNVDHVAMRDLQPFRSFPNKRLPLPCRSHRL